MNLEGVIEGYLEDINNLEARITELEYDLKQAKDENKDLENTVDAVKSKIEDIELYLDNALGSVKEAFREI